MKLPIPPRSLMVFLSKVKALWREWNIHTMLLTSFAMQLILILVVPFRKKTSNQIVKVSIWLAYLLADWVAAQAIGLIANPLESMISAEAGSTELYAFWAQFLLLHLGGPDTITALALEDNELWLRTGLHLGVQVYGGLGILVKSIAQYRSNLWLPTILMFMAGILKYLERVTSLFRGRLLKFCRKQHLEELDESNSDSHSIPILSRVVQLEQLTNVEMVRSAYCLFHYFKGLYADQHISIENGDQTRILSFSKTKSEEEAFRQVEMQLNFAYEAFYTKTVIIHTSWSWKVLRFLVALLLVWCLAIWLFFTNKQGFLHYYNIQITYTLLIGAVIVEFLAFVRIQFSDWTIAQVERDSRIKILFYNRFLSAYKKCMWGEYWRKKDAPTWAYLRRLFFRRWSESISQMNMISMCIEKPRPDNLQKVIDFFELKDVLDKCKYVSHKWFSNHLKRFIFEDIKRIRNFSNGMAIANLGHSKGGLAFKCFRKSGEIDYGEPQRHASPPNTLGVCHTTMNLFNIHLDYDVILMRWHIITELCYVSHLESSQSAESYPLEEVHQEVKDYPNVKDYREICKTLSDYLFSLLIYQPEMMPTVAATEDRSRELKAKLKEVEKELSLHNSTNSTDEKRREFCVRIREVFTDEQRDCTEPIKPGFPIDEIMRELEKLEEELGELAKWKLMAEVWAELLYYAALRCKPRLHAAKLKQGGELLSVVWMLLLQFGYGLHAAPHSLIILGETQTRPQSALLVADF